MTLFYSTTTPEIEDTVVNKPGPSYTKLAFWWAETKSKDVYRDFPGGLVVKNPPSNAGDVGSIPGRGTKIPHAVGQLSPRATNTELMRLN